MILPIRPHIRCLLACLLVLAGLMGSRPAAAQGVEPVFGLRGVLQPVSGQPFATVLIEPGGERYGIVGATPAIEQTLTELAAQEQAVKVWGNLQRQSPLSQTPLIVATNVLQDVNPPVATPIGTPTPRPTPTPIPPLATRPTALPIPTMAPITINAPLATVTVYAAYLRAGPGSQYPTLQEATQNPSSSVLSQGTVCAVIGRAGDGRLAQAPVSGGDWLDPR